MAASEDDIKIALSEFNAADAMLHKCIPGKPGFGIEAKYKQAYQRLVQMGEKPQIKLKYRRTSR